MWNIVGSIVGGAIGKTIGKIIEQIPSPDESRRNQLKKLRKERDAILKQPQSTKSNTRLSYIMARIGVLEGAAVNK